jgi:hypothetical protein
VVVEREDEVRASNHPDRNAVAELDGDLGHARTLALRLWHRMVDGILHEPLEHAAPQPPNPSAHAATEGRKRAHGRLDERGGVRFREERR